LSQFFEKKNLIFSLILIWLKLKKINFGNYLLERIKIAIDSPRKTTERAMEI